MKTIFRSKTNNENNIPMGNKRKFPFIFPKKTNFSGKHYRNKRKKNKNKIKTNQIVATATTTTSFDKQSFPAIHNKR